MVKRAMVTAVAAAALGIAALAGGHSWSSAPAAAVAGHDWIGGTPNDEDRHSAGHGNPWHGSVPAGHPWSNGTTDGHPWHN